MAYDARTLKQTAVLNTSPDAGESGIWQSDMAPAADQTGQVYVVTGNGAFDADKGGHNWGDSVLKLALSGGALTVRDAFTPWNQSALNNQDKDLGSGGPILVPGALLIAGKESPLYVLDRRNLKAGKPQTIDVRGGMYATPAYWNGHVFFAATNDTLKDFKLAQGQLAAEPAAAGTQRFANPGAGPVVSANGTRDAIVWLIETKVWNDYASTKPSVLRAYDAANVARELYNSEQNPSCDRAGAAVRFTLPTIANGRVYVGAKKDVTVYGLLK
jgi:hypothetical protein